MICARTPNCETQCLNNDSSVNWLCLSRLRSFRMTEVVLKVDMTCGGCKSAVERVLGKMDGVESFDVNLEEQKVVVKGSVTPEAVLEKIQKTGKKAELIH